MQIKLFEERGYKLDLKNKIFIHLKSEIFKYKSGDLWTAQQWSTFRNNLCEAQAKKFDSIINELCDDGIFTAEPYNKDLSNYRLTDKGEAILRNLI